MSGLLKSDLVRKESNCVFCVLELLLCQGSGTVRVFAGNGRLVLLPLADEGFNFPSFVKSFVATIFLFNSLDWFRPLDSILERTISELDSDYSKP